MLNYFSDKDSSFFKSSKKFWNFYKRALKTKKSAIQKIHNLKINDDNVLKSISDPKQITQEFNKYFCNFQLPTDVSEDCLIDSIDKNFLELKQKRILNLSPHLFHLNYTDSTQVLELLNKLQVSSSPGVSNILVRVIKICAESIAFVLTKQRFLINGNKQSLLHYLRVKFQRNFVTTIEA